MIWANKKRPRSTRLCLSFSKTPKTVADATNERLIVPTAKSREKGRIHNMTEVKKRAAFASSECWFFKICNASIEEGSNSNVALKTHVVKGDGPRKCKLIRVGISNNISLRLPHMVSTKNFPVLIKQQRKFAPSFQRARSEKLATIKITKQQGSQTLSFTFIDFTFQI